MKGYYKIAKLLLTNNIINKNSINNNGKTSLDIVNYNIQLNDNNNDKSYISVKKKI